MDNIELDQEETLEVIKVSIQVIELIENSFANQKEYSAYNMIMNVITACQVTMMKHLPPELRDTFIRLVMQNLMANHENLKNQGL